jgi:hypothetical protein
MGHSAMEVAMQELQYNYYAIWHPDFTSYLKINYK